MLNQFADASAEEINYLMQKAWIAFHQYKKLTARQRADFMRAIAIEIENLGDVLLETAVAETALPLARLRSERARTIFQLTSYAAAMERGDWLEARIDTANAQKNSAKPDIRKMQVPIGPVVVFGAANFPFAYSTAGGDTACALAAGCPVIVKAHPAHANTSEMVAGAVLKAAADTYMPPHVFTHVHGASFEVGKALVEHEHTKAVGFTGSFAGGKQLFDIANQRKVPIPVFAEMSSVNPVYLLPGKMKTDAAVIAKTIAASVTLGAGQFCTNPGLIIGVDNNDLNIFINALDGEIKKSIPGEMLHAGIFKNYVEKRAVAVAQDAVEIIAVSDTGAGLNQALPTITATTAINFIQNPLLHHEVFGPFSIVIKCKDMQEMLQVAQHIEGQLTSTVMATAEDILQYSELTDAIQNTCGRFIFNGVPTGVEVCLSMQHGGPFPATTDARFGAVGADGIKRFTRPVAFQNWPDELLPAALQNANPLNIWRTVNDELTKEGW